MRSIGRLGIGLAVALVGCGPQFVAPPFEGAAGGGQAVDLGFGFPNVVPDIAFPPAGPPPIFGPTQVQANPPPALSGGTLLVANDGTTAIAADPDRDAVSLVDLAGQKVIATLALLPGDEPGRAVEDGARRVHLVLRGAGAIETIDLASASLLGREPVCPAPRGIAYDATNDRIHVACAGGELVTLPAAGGAPVRTLQLDPDLRDVVVDGPGLLVSRFRSAEVLALDQYGTVLTRSKPDPQVSMTRKGVFQPNVAWRMLALPSGGAVMVHQRADDGPIDISQGTQGGYGGGGFNPCGPDSIVQSAVTTFSSGATSWTSSGSLGIVLAIDVAVSASGQFAVASAGESKIPSKVSVIVGDVAALDQMAPCNNGPIVVQGQPIAVAFSADGSMWLQTREPATLQRVPFRDGNGVLQNGASPLSIALATDSREDTGHAIFHSDSGAGIACASCHPEGGDDGRTWLFIPTGPRRTKSLRGGVLALAPFHWDGDLPDLPSLMTEVFVRRMSGIQLAPDQLNALGGWLDKVPALPHAPPADPAAVMRGSALFNDPNIGCTGCHSDSRYTTNTVVDVGTGKPFKIPSLAGVAFRAPYLHDGCAATLPDRFGACGGAMHGNTSQLTTAQIDDLVAFLQTL